MLNFTGHVDHTLKTALISFEKRLKNTFFVATTVAQAWPKISQIYLVSYIFHVIAPIFFYAILSDNDC